MSRRVNYYQASRPAYKQTPKKRLGSERSIGHILGSAAGGMLGSALAPEMGGGPIGEFLGGKIGHLAEQVMGFGDYKVKHNSVLNGGMDPPTVENYVNNGGIVVRHREYIGDVLASSEFTIRKFPINPGNSLTFPWLSVGPAKSYEIYRLQGMLFEFISTSSDAILSDSTSSALGTINLATDYDALDNPYPDKVSMLNAQFSNSTKPSCNCIHPIECAKSLTPVTEMFISDGTSTAPNMDPRLNDIGNFYIATEGQQVGEGDPGVIGELWCTYEVFLAKTQLLEPAILGDTFALGAITSSQWLGGPVANAENQLGTVIVNGNQIYFPNDNNELVGKHFWITYNQGGTSSAAAQEVLYSLNACEPFDIFGGGTAFWQSPAGGTSTTSVTVTFGVTILPTNENGTTVTFGTKTTVGGTVTGQLTVLQAPDFVQNPGQVTKKKKKIIKKRLI